jgi:hypothetical protein
MFASKAGAYPSGEPERCTSLSYARGLEHKHYNRLERLAKNKHFFNMNIHHCNVKTFMTLAPGACTVKLIMAIIILISTIIP